MQFTNSPRLQAGQSLISMMVGLVISLITIAAMLTLYKVMIEVSGNASRSAMRDGQVSSAILAAQILAVSDADLYQRLVDARAAMRQSVLDKDRKLAVE